MKAEICRADPSREFLTAEKCFILEVANDANDPEISISWARIPAKVTTEWHRVRGIAERYVIVSGTGRVEVGNVEPTVVGPGDVVRIPANTPQRMANVGDTDLVFLCVCSPRFVPDAYVPGPDDFQD